LTAYPSKHAASNGNDAYARQLRRNFEQFCDHNRQLEQSRDSPIRPPAICAVLCKVLADMEQRAIVTVDVGVTTLWVYRHLVGGNHEIVWTSSFATMGFAMPAAIAIAEAEPERPVVAIAGDGGIAITMAELASAAAREVPIVVIVFNNGKLAAIKYEQEVMGWPEFESGLDNPDFAEYARACGAHGIRVTDPEKLEPSLREAFAGKRACLVDVVCDPHDLPAPPKVHLRQAAGYLIAVSREGRSGLKEFARQVGKLATFSP
jgi:thiamine pyrophosphate-dependent acetolactate synthase large subunit-like protein